MERAGNRITASVISFTAQGHALSIRLAKALEEKVACRLYGKGRECRQPEFGQLLAVEGTVSDWAGSQFAAGNAIILVGACGIAVRSIAPWLSDKLSDVPVLVVDEAGKFVIPILSGHYGGANELACLVAEALGAVPVITTATDVRGVFAVDVFARKNHLSIANRSGIAAVSSRLLAEGHISMQLDGSFVGMVPSELSLVKEHADVCVSVRRADAALWLVPKVLVLGMGCRKGKRVDEIEAFVQAHLAGAGIPMEAIGTLATIDIKKAEPGLVAFADRHQLVGMSASADRLKEVAGNFSASRFVLDTVGVDNVCERAAMLAAGAGGHLLLGKTAGDGMTMAVAEPQWSVSFS